MCTLVAWLSVFPEAPLVVAANRDERLGRPASGPRLHDGPRPFLAPRDEVAGGSWWAIGAGGLFVGLTNRAGATLSADRRSRGLLVTEVGRARGVEDAERLLRSLDPRDYNGFHLLVTDGLTGVRAVADGVKIVLDRVGPGRHLLTERGFGAADHSREVFVESLLERFEGRPLDLDGLARTLATHHDPSLDGLCVHLPEVDYGTRSSTIYARRSDGTPYEALDGLLEKL
jgi:uncharacterized protein with NRDE domain